MTRDRCISWQSSNFQVISRFLSPFGISSSAGAALCWPRNACFPTSGREEGTMVKVNVNKKSRFSVAKVLAVLGGLAIVAVVATLVPHVFAGTMRVLFKIKVLPLGQYDSLNAELKKTQKDLEIMTVTDKKVKKEAAANFEAFNEAKQHKIAAEERNTAAMKKISDLEAKMKAMENHMAEAKALAASSINKMDDGLLRGRTVANEIPATKKDSQAAAQKEKGGDIAKNADDMLVAATGGGEAGEDSAAKKKEEEKIKKVAAKRGLRR